MTIADLPALLDELGLDRARVASIFDDLRGRMQIEVDAVIAEQANGSAWPTVDFADVRSGAVDPALLDRVRRRGCLIMRSTFDRDQAETWDEEVADYLATNEFERRFAERYPEAATAKIWGVYWSPPQVAARQHPDMAVARRFLNSFWRHESEGRRWLDPSHDIGYPDRLRRRAPGVEARGLPPHSDSVSTGGWRSEENARVFRHVLAGDVDRYDPWDAAHRTSLDPESAAPSSVFRTFQGWTALSEMHPNDGVLRTIPIPCAAAYMLMRGIAGELGLLGDEPEAAPHRFRADDLLMPAMVPIPEVEPGDTVWWHGDIIHSVEPAANTRRWGNVMYIAVAPRCPRNDAYAATMLDRFVEGRSPVDFPADDFEVDFVGRPTISALGELGRDQFGLT